MSSPNRFSHREHHGIARREALVRIGLGAAGLVGLPRGLVSPGGTRLAGLDDLAARLGRAAGPAAFDVAAEAIRSGADEQALLGAIFLCGVRDIRPRPHGILHAVMMVESSFQLAQASPPGESWLPVFWNLEAMKQGQASDLREADDWSLGPPPAPPRGQSAEQARRELLAAMEAWDPGRADRAIVALVAHHDQEALSEILWPLGARCYAFIGHKMIHAAQMERVLARIGWQHAESPLRSLVATLLVDRNTTAFERSRELAEALPPGWLRGREDPETSRALLRELATSSPRAAQDRVVSAVKDGVGPRTIWDALRLLGSEVFLRRPGRSASAGRGALLPVHAVTVVNALGHAWRSTTRDATRRVLVLQAAAWVASLRDDMGHIVSLKMAGPGIDSLGTSAADDPASPVASSPAVIEHASPAGARRYLDREPAEASRFIAALRSALFRKGQEHHQFKYAAAMAEESRLVDGRWASRILAPGVDYLANPEDPETEAYRRSRHALRKAGVGG